jgi:general secretion pathway protein E
VGCDVCGETGYTGRLAIVEILLMTDPIRELILQRCDVGDIARLAKKQGMVAMRDDGLAKAVAGLTTIEEVLRVTPAAPENSG